MIPLDQIKVASPCRQSWNEMDGDSQARFCQSCRQKVYDISEMTRAEAETLIREKEGHLCVRFFRRTDGTVMTKDCPVGLRAVRLRFAAAFSGMMAILLGGVRAAADPPATVGEATIPTAIKSGKPTARPTMGLVAIAPRTSKKHTSGQQKPTSIPEGMMGKMSLGSHEPKRHSTPLKHTGHKDTDKQTAYKENDR